jgi:hypothetical protein
MKIISVIEDEEIIKKILKPFGLWKIKERPPPKTTGSPRPTEYHIDSSTSQLPASDKVAECRFGLSGDSPFLIFEEKIGFNGFLYKNFHHFRPFGIIKAAWLCLHLNPLVGSSSPFQALEL